MAHKAGQRRIVTMGLRLGDIQVEATLSKETLLVISACHKMAGALLNHGRGCFSSDLARDKEKT
jgi:hypothetical protein